MFLHEGIGIVPELLNASLATYSAQAGSLDVVARTTFGGRTELSVSGFGPLDYAAATISHGATFATTPPPATLQIVSVHGGAWDVPVVFVP